MNLRRLTLHQLRVFRAVERHRNLTRAAEDLYLTQSAVSAQVRPLTEVLGVALFEQFGKKIHLTSAGRSLLEHALRMEAAVEELGLEFTALQEGGAGRVRVGASTSIGTYLLPGLIAEFSSRHPRADVSLEMENTAHVQERLLRNEFDVAFVGAPVNEPELVAEPFLDDEVFFACAPTKPLPASPLSSLEDLTGFRLIVRAPGSATRQAMEEHCRMRGIVFRQSMQLGSVEAIQQAVMAGLGISYFSGLTVRREVRSRRLARLDIADGTARRTFFLARHRSKVNSPILEMFLEFARNWADRDTGRGSWQARHRAERLGTCRP